LMRGRRGFLCRGCCPPRTGALPPLLSRRRRLPHRRGADSSLPPCTAEAACAASALPQTPQTGPPDRPRPFGPGPARAFGPRRRRHCLPDWTGSGRPSARASAPRHRRRGPLHPSSSCPSLPANNLEFSFRSCDCKISEITRIGLYNLSQSGNTSLSFNFFRWRTHVITPDLNIKLKKLHDRPGQIK
jgi:hypothetical protein